MERIDSLQNSRVKKWCLLHEKKGRDAAGCFLVEGEHLVAEALQAGAAETILTDRDPVFSFANTIAVSEAVMRKLSQTPSGTHVMAVCRKRELPLIKKDRLLMLDGIQDPGNFGTLIRTALSFSFDGVLCSEVSCDLYNEKVIRSTQGALFRMPVVRCDLTAAVSRLQQEGVVVAATALQQAVPLKTLAPAPQMAFILGNEGQGVDPQLRQQADVCVRIEMDGFESLNVAVAGGIVMYQYRG